MGCYTNGKGEQLSQIWMPTCDAGKNVSFLGDSKTPKGHFEINWPLGLHRISKSDPNLKNSAIVHF